jgi:pilus assembly protein Flp/PilA
MTIMRSKTDRWTMHRFGKSIRLAAGQARSLAREEAGTTAIEYALIASGISIVIVVAVTTLGTTTNGMYQSVVDALK